MQWNRIKLEVSEAVSLRGETGLIFLTEFEEGWAESVQS